MVKVLFVCMGNICRSPTAEAVLDDFRECDFILAMDWENLTAMQQICPPMYKHKLALLMRYASENDTAVVPDPYYGGNEGFNTVLDYCEDACEGLLDVVKKRACMYTPSRNF